MTSKRLTKKAKAALVPQTREELRQLITATIDAQTRAEAAVAKRDALLNRMRERIEAKHGFDKTIAEAEGEASRNLELVEMWSEANKAEFGELRSMAEGGARFGWRLGNWSVQTEGTQAATVERLKRLVQRGAAPQATARQMARGALAARFLRITAALDKQAALAAREDAKTKPVLKFAGVSFEQDETFYLDPEREGQKPALMVAGDG